MQLQPSKDVFSSNYLSGCIHRYAKCPLSSDRHYIGAYLSYGVCLEVAYM